MIAKISTWGADREQARRRMAGALRQTAILGLTTNLPFLIDLMDHPAFAAGDTHTGFLSEHFPNWQPGEPPHTLAAALAASLHRGPTAQWEWAGRSAFAGPLYTVATAWRLAARLLIPE